MPTTIITGRDVSLTLNGSSYDAQATSAVLSNEHTIETYQTLNGRAYEAIDDQWTFTIELLADWGATSSLFESMWNEATNYANSTVAVVLTAETGAVFNFNVLPIYPTVGGVAPGAQTDTWTFTVIGEPTPTFS